MKEKLENKNIAFIGFMGSGKTFTSKELGKILKRKVYSTDNLIEAKERQKIREIFDKKGELYFRHLEKLTVAQVVRNKGVVIDCGGGIILNPLNIERLRQNGILIYLKTSPKWILKRTQDGTDRPLLQTKDPMGKIKELLKKRKSLYEQADITVLTDAKTPAEVAQDVSKILKKAYR
jgi:shikimate kinase